MCLLVFDAPLLVQHSLGSRAEEVIHNHSHNLPGTDSPVLRVLHVFSKLPFSSILEIFKHALDGSC